MKQFRETNYWITEDGRGWSERSNKYMKGSKDSYGYTVVKIRFGKSPKLMKLHRLVAESYIPNPENKPTVNHKDGDKSNNDVSNLEWATVYENNKHAAENGLFKVPNRMFSKEDVLDIYSLSNAGYSAKSISVTYNCNDTTICRVLNGKTYKEYYAKD